MPRAESVTPADADVDEPIPPQQRERFDRRWALAAAGAALAATACDVFEGGIGDGDLADDEFAGRVLGEGEAPDGLGFLDDEPEVTDPVPSSVPVAQPEGSTIVDDTLLETPLVDRVPMVDGGGGATAWACSGPTGCWWREGEHWSRGAGGGDDGAGEADTRGARREDGTECAAARAQPARASFLARDARRGADARRSRHRSTLRWWRCELVRL